MANAYLFLRATIATILVTLFIAILLAPSYPKFDSTKRALDSILRDLPAMLDHLADRLQRRMGQSVENLFSRLDTNHDGVLSLAEFRVLELSVLASLDDLRSGLPSLPSLDALDLDGVDLWPLCRRFVAAHCLLLALAALGENVRAALTDAPSPFPPDAAVRARTPPHVAVAEALRYDTPPTAWERAKMAAMVISLHVVVRAVLAVTCLVGGAALVGVAARGKRGTRWFRTFARLARMCGMASLWCIGFYHIRVFGKPSTSPDVKIMVGNHVCAIEVVFLFIALEFPSFVSRVENLGIPFFGGIVKAAHAIVVARDDPASRQATVDAIHRRATDVGGGPVTMIFPEGTCGNHRALFTFRTGAFRPGRPVQLVAFKYHYRHFNPAWTGRATGGNDPFDLILRLLCQWVNRLDVCFGPEVYPTEAEKEDPEKFAKTCQRMMANMLGCATSDATFTSYKEVQKQLAQRPEK